MKMSIAHNPNSKNWVKQKFDQKLKTYQKDCDLFLSVTEDLNQMGDTFVEPCYRPLGLDSNLKKLEALKKE